MSEDLLREELHRLVDPLQPSPGAFDAVRRQRAARRRWRVMVPLAVAGATAAAVVSAVALVPAGDPTPVASPLGPTDAATSDGDATASPTAMPTSATASPSPDDEPTKVAVPPTIDLQRVAWSGSLPTDHPSRFVAEYARGLGLFSAVDGRLLRMLVEAGTQQCKLRNPYIRDEGSLVYEVHPVEGATAQECGFAGAQFSWHPETGPSTIREEEPLEAFADGRRVQVHVSHDDDRSIVLWIAGNDDSESQVEAAIGQPALSDDGRLAVLASPRGSDQSALAVVPWGGTLAEATWVRSPGGGFCQLTSPHWVSTTDSTGTTAELVLAVEVCSAARADGSASYHPVLVDPARGELLWTGGELPHKGLGIDYIDLWGAAVLYQAAAGDQTGVIRVAAGGEVRLLDTRHPTDENDCSSIDPVRPCAADPIWVPDGWAE